MKNIYTNIAFGLLIAVISALPAFSDAASFQPTSRTYYPAGNAQPINIVNNNYNNNVNTNNNPAPIAYTASAYSGIDVHNIAQNNLPKHTYSTSKKAYTKSSNKTVVKSTTCGSSCGTSYRLVQKSNCGSTVAIANAYVPKPTCSLVPSISANGAIELQWTTNGATVAYLDNGIGHINTITGKRIITPTKDTAYNLTVLNDAGIAGTCSAKVNVSLAKAGEVNVLATNSNYTYSLNGNTQVSSISTVAVTGGGKPAQQVGNTENTGVNSSTIGTSGEGKVNTNVDIKKDTATVKVSESTNILSKIFGDGFKKVALPIGIVFLILIVLLMVIMSKVKAAK